VVVLGERLIVHFGHQGTACLDLSGNVVWRHQDLQYSPVHGNGGSPIVIDGKVIFSCDGASDPFIVALDVETGKQIWKTSRSVEADRRFSFSTPTVVRWRGQLQIVSPGSNAVCGYSVDGIELWKVRYDGYSVIPKPVFANDLIYVCTGFNRPSLLAIRPGGRGDSTESHLVWTTRSQVPHTPSVLVIDNLLYMVSDRGIASCLVAETGEEVWQERLTGKGFSASPLFADGKIYFTSEDGVTTVLRPGLEFGKLAENDLGERTLASLGVVDQSILIRTEAALYRITQ
jgi:outer membrane protein assembly factor BamB